MFTLIDRPAPSLARQPTRCRTAGAFRVLHEIVAIRHRSPNWVPLGADPSCTLSRMVRAAGGDRRLAGLWTDLRVGGRFDSLPDLTAALEAAFADLQLASHPERATELFITMLGGLAPGRPEPLTSWVQVALAVSGSPELTDLLADLSQGWRGSAAELTAVAATITSNATGSC